MSETTTQGGEAPVVVRLSMASMSRQSSEHFTTPKTCVPIPTDVGNEDSAPPAYFGIVFTGPVAALAMVAFLVAVVLPLFLQADVFPVLSLLPSCFAGVWAYQRHSEWNLRKVVLRFWAGWMVVLPVSLLFVILASLLIAVPALFLIIAMHASPSIAVFVMLLIMFFVLSATEEFVKHVVHRRCDPITSKHSIVLRVATALGLGTGLSYYLCILISVVLEAWANYSCGRNDKIQQPCDSRIPFDDSLILVANSVVLQLVHVASSYHVSLVTARVEVLKESSVEALHLNQSIALAICFRGFFITAVVWSLIFTGLWSFLIAILLSAGYLVYVKRYEKNMPRDYLERVGYGSL